MIRKFSIAGLVALLAGVAATVAMAAAPAVVTVQGAVSPDKGGSKKKPRNAAVAIAFNVNPESDSTLSRIVYTIPDNVKLDARGFKTCSVAMISQSGESACPAGSKVGTGSAAALLGPNKSALDFVVSVYAAGRKSLTLYLKTNLFTVAIPATIEGQQVAFDIPENVQRPVSGLYSYVTSVSAILGKQPGISGKTKVKKTVKVKVRKKVKIKGTNKTRTKTVTRKRRKKVNHFFASLRGCPTTGTHLYGVDVTLAPNPDPPAQPTASGAAASACS